MKILVACIGNIFLGDDGFGVEVARRLIETRALPENAVVKDFGIRGLDLAYALLDAWDVAILVDACPRGGKPGDVYVIEPDPEKGAISIDPHAMNPINVLRTARSMGGVKCPVLVVGCEPGDLGPEEGKLGLTPAVAAAVDEAAALVENLVGRIERGEPVWTVEQTQKESKGESTWQWNWSR